MPAPEDGIDRSRELRLLGRLCRELAKENVGVGIRDALPAVTVHAATDGPAGVGLYVFISASGNHFQWRGADHSHPVSDITGAAHAIADFVRQDETSAAFESDDKA